MWVFCCVSALDRGRAVSVGSLMLHSLVRIGLFYGVRMARKFLGSASLLAPLILAAMVVAGRADDGVVLINQSKVMAAGGFPYTIKTPGSYRLAGNLTVPRSNEIDVSATPVSIHLNGFTITGQNFGVGVMTNPTSQTTLAVSNGTIQNFGSGVDVSGGGLLTVNNLTVLNASEEAFF